MKNYFIQLIGFLLTLNILVSCNLNINANDSKSGNFNPDEYELYKVVFSLEKSDRETIENHMGYPDCIKLIEDFKLHIGSEKLQELYSINDQYEKWNQIVDLLDLYIKENLNKVEFDLKPFIKVEDGVEVTNATKVNIKNEPVESSSSIIEKLVYNYFNILKSTRGSRNIDFHGEYFSKDMYNKNLEVKIKFVFGIDVDVHVNYDDKVEYKHKKKFVIQSTSRGIRINSVVHGPIKLHAVPDNPESAYLLQNFQGEDFQRFGINSVKSLYRGYPVNETYHMSKGSFPNVGFRYFESVEETVSSLYSGILYKGEKHSTWDYTFLNLKSDWRKKRSQLLGEKRIDLNYVFGKIDGYYLKFGWDEGTKKYVDLGFINYKNGIKHGKFFLRDLYELDKVSGSYTNGVLTGKYLWAKKKWDKKDSMSYLNHTIKFNENDSYERFEFDKKGLKNGSYELILNSRHYPQYPRIDYILKGSFKNNQLYGHWVGKGVFYLSKVDRRLINSFQDLKKYPLNKKIDTLVMFSANYNNLTTEYHNLKDQIKPYLYTNLSNDIPIDSSYYPTGELITGGEFQLQGQDYFMRVINDIDFSLIKDSIPRLLFKDGFSEKWIDINDRVRYEIEYSNGRKTGNYRKLYEDGKIKESCCQ